MEAIFFHTVEEAYKWPGQSPEAWDLGTELAKSERGDSIFKDYFVKMSLIYGTFMHWLPWAGTPVTLSHFGGRSWRGCRKHHCFYCCRGMREPFPGTGFLGEVWWGRGNRAGWAGPKSGPSSCLLSSTVMTDPATPLPLLPSGCYLKLDVLLVINIVILITKYTKFVFKFWIWSFIYHVDKYAPTYVWAMAQVWRSEGNLGKLVLSFCHIGPRGGNSGCLGRGQVSSISLALFL